MINLLTKWKCKYALPVSVTVRNLLRASPHTLSERQPFAFCYKLSNCLVIKTRVLLCARRLPPLRRKCLTASVLWRKEVILRAARALKIKSVIIPDPVRRRERLESRRGNTPPAKSWHFVYANYCSTQCRICNERGHDTAGFCGLFHRPPLLLLMPATESASKYQQIIADHCNYFWRRARTRRSLFSLANARFVCAHRMRHLINAPS